MKAREIKQLACRHAALILDSDLAAMDPPSEWEEKPLSNADTGRWYAAMYQIRNELGRRGGIYFTEKP